MLRLAKTGLAAASCFIKKTQIHYFLPKVWYLSNLSLMGEIVFLCLLHSMSFSDIMEQLTSVKNVAINGLYNLHSSGMCFNAKYQMLTQL